MRMKPRKISLLELVRKETNCSLFTLLGYLEFKKTYDKQNGFICHRCSYFNACVNYKKKVHSKDVLTASIGESIKNKKE